MAATWILKFPQVDKPDDPILVHITQKQGTTLDLDLIATDGGDAYKGKVRQRNLSKLQSKNFDGTDEEWSSLLHYAFVSKRDSQASDEQIKNLEIDAVISGKKSKATLLITLRSRIEDITHKLGAVELSYQEDTNDVDLFNWACVLADQRNKLEEQEMSASKEAKSTKHTISSLQTQLDELVKAKEDHEDQLLTKFSALLNEKKLKIRDYQRTLATAKVDKKAYKEVQATVGTRKDTTPNKRKREKEKAQAGDETEESEGFEAMDVDKNPADHAQDTAESGNETPPRSQTPETETASEDDDAVAPSKSKSGPSATTSKTKRNSPPPPPRQLPFQQKKKEKKENAGSKKPKQHSKAQKNDDETESEDDEL